MPNGPYVSGDLVRRPAAVVSRIGTSSVLMHMAANQKTVLKSCALWCRNPALCRLAHPGCSGSGPIVPKPVAEAFASALCTASDTTAALCLTRAATQKIGHDLSWICATWLPVETEHWGSKTTSNSCNLADLVPTNTGFWIQRAPYDRDCKQNLSVFQIPPIQHWGHKAGTLCTCLDSCDLGWEYGHLCCFE